MVWSPFSNLLLYGQAADVRSAKAAGSDDAPFKIALGSDWSPSGRKSLFGELRVARVYSEHNSKIFGDTDLAHMVTATAAEILKWPEVGSIAVGKRADLVVVAGQHADAYEAFLEGAVIDPESNQVTTTAPSGAKHDRSAGAAPDCCRQGLGGLLERERRRGRDLELPGRDQLGELAERAAVGLHDHRRDLDAPLLVRWVLGDRRKVTAVAHGADRDG